MHRAFYIVGYLACILVSQHRAFYISEYYIFIPGAMHIAFYVVEYHICILGLIPYLHFRKDWLCLIYIYKIHWSEH